MLLALRAPIRNPKSGWPSFCVTKKAKDTKKNIFKTGWHR